MGQPFKCGDILFVRGKSPLAKVINFFDGEFSHCVVAVSNKSILEAQYFTKTRITPVYFDDYEVVDLGFSTQQRDKVIHLAVDLTGKQYDYYQVLYLLFENLFKLNNKYRWNSPNNMICSEIVSYLLLQLNWFKCLEDVDRVLNSTPNELYELLKIK